MRVTWACDPGKAYAVLANMKVITQIYMNCRPELRDEWLTGTDVEDLGEFMVFILYLYSQT